MPQHQQQQAALDKANFHFSLNVYRCKSIFSTPFYVYTTKKFLWMEGLSPNTSWQTHLSRVAVRFYATTPFPC
jgi:hypothetical protein